MTGLVVAAVVLLTGGSSPSPAPGIGSSGTAPASPATSFTGPSGANAIGAASAGSLFKTSNLVPVLSDLTNRFGASASVASVTLYPGEVDLVVDEQGGVARPVRIERDGAIAEGTTSQFNVAPNTIYLSQLSAAVPQALAQEIARVGGVPVGRLDRMVLVTDLPGHNAGWRIYELGSGSQTFQALLDGTSLKRLG
jgi:hypothetical protein